MPTKGIRAMIKGFVEMGKLGAQPGRSCICVTPVIVDALKSAVNAQSQTSEFARIKFLYRQAILTALSKKYSIMHYFPYKIRLTQELLDRDKPQCLLFTVNFRNRMSVYLLWTWNILRSDEAHFYHNGTVNTHNCHIWAKENTRILTEDPLQSPKVTIRWGFMATTVLGPFVFEEISELGPVTCFVTGHR
ncbi:DUF4817 domain-containing protein [Trichonephila clavipes]|uniref:DUF4817 domain-containing protein n=1 Tax=Trichonephila clavipes TaxID=2585209 RepID=A0A8X6VV77_TRICX|nr:DUF4817 domain-containing protein [Trichonephila clavipes]